MNDVADPDTGAASGPRPLPLLEEQTIEIPDAHQRKYLFKRLGEAWPTGMPPAYRSLLGAVLSSQGDDGEKLAEIRAAVTQVEQLAERREMPPEAAAPATGAVHALQGVLAQAERSEVPDLAPLDAALGELQPHIEAAKRVRDLGLLKGATQLAVDALAAGDPTKVSGLASQARALAAGLTTSAPFFTLRQSLRDVREIPWLCRPFQWTPGRPNLVIGFAGDGKTTAILAVLVAFSLGWPAWGRGELRASRQCRCLYVDLDMGADAASFRLRDVARGMGVTDYDIDDAVERFRASGRDLGGYDDVLVGRGGKGLTLQCSDRGGIPTPADEAAFREAWEKAVKGFDLVVIDAFRYLAPTMDSDRDPRISVPLTALRDVSISTGAVFVILQHSPKDGRAGARPDHQRSKGNASIDGATGSHLTIWREKDDRRRAKLTRGASMDWEPLDGYLDQQTADGETCSRIVFSPAPPKEAPKAKEKAEVPTDDISLVRDVLKANPGIEGKLNLAAKLVDEHAKRKPRAKPMARQRSWDAVQALRDAREVDERFVKVSGKDRPRWTWCPPAPPDPVEAKDGP